MSAKLVSRRITAAQEAAGPVIRFLSASRWARRLGEPGISNFAVGNPQELALPEFVDALTRAVAPRNKDWYAYTLNDPAACSVAAASLREWRGVPFEENDIFMTSGAGAALGACLNAVVDPGDEVIFISPPWFFYEALIVFAGGSPVRVKADPATFDLDLAAIGSALSPQTRAIIINSPNNPTGRIYPRASLAGLSDLLTRRSAEYGRPIYLLSDEAYSRIIFDGRDYPSPTSYYPQSFLIYTYSKTLLTPGQGLGYIALPPTMPERGAMRAAIFTSLALTGRSFPSALMQHALPDLDRLSIDMAAVHRKRDRLAGALRAMGYPLQLPEGTFYLLVQAPEVDDMAFIERLTAHDIFCLPGTIVELPGYFRISLTATDEMITQALPGFAAAREEAAGHPISAAGV